METGAISTASPARHSAFQRISFFGSERPRQMRAFLIANGLWRHMFELLGPRIPKGLQPNSGKLPFSEDSRWRRKNKSTAFWLPQSFSVSAKESCEAAIFAI